MSSEPPTPEPPPAPAPSTPPQGPRHRFDVQGKQLGPVLAAMVIVVALAVGVTVVVRHHAADVLASQRLGEIFLQGAGSAGPDPFTPSVAHSGPAVTPPTPTSTPTPPPDAPAGAVVIEAPPGSTPALYGGTNNQSACDSQALVTDLQSHPDAASAWVATLNADHSLYWTGGSQVLVDQIAQYVAELTAVRLRSDTRITDHGLVSGRTTPFQAVLQAGTAVLVDALGVPRARCASGNPLTPPVAVTVAPTYIGDPPWPGFSPASLTAVSPAPSPIVTFVLVDLDNPTETLSLPAGGTLPQPFTPSPSAVPSPTPSRVGPSLTPTPSRSPSPSSQPITLTPNSGPSSGGTNVRVSGRGFSAEGGVQHLVFYTTQGFLAAEVTSFSVDSDSQITLTTGPATSNGGCNTGGCITFLSIQFASGTSISVSNAFRFIVTSGAPPSETASPTASPNPSPSPSATPSPSRPPSTPEFAVTSITPNSGPAVGGTAVTIKGYGFKSHGGVTLVDFHSAGGFVADSPSNVQLVSDTEITLMTGPVSPSNCGTSCTTTLYIQFADGTGFSSLTFTFQ